MAYHDNLMASVIQTLKRRGVSVTRRADIMTYQLEIRFRGGQRCYQEVSEYYVRGDPTRLLRFGEEALARAKDELLLLGPSKASFNSRVLEEDYKVLPKYALEEDYHSLQSSKPTTLSSDDEDFDNYRYSTKLEIQAREWLEAA